MMYLVVNYCRMEGFPLVHHPMRCREKSGNIDLLRYRVQTLEEQVGRYRAQTVTLAELQHENRTLRQQVCTYVEHGMVFHAI